MEAAGVHLHCGVAANHPSLALPQVGSAGRVEGWGGAIGGTRVVIEAVGEGGAVRDARCMGTCTSGPIQKHF
jgi:hypothetical protein